MRKKREKDIESDNLHSISAVLKDTFMQIEHPAEVSSREGVPSGFSDFSLNIVRHAGVELKKPVVIFSLRSDVNSGHHSAHAAFCFL